MTLEWLSEPQCSHRTNGNNTGGTGAGRQEWPGEAGSANLLCKGPGSQGSWPCGSTVCEATSPFMKAAAHERKVGGRVPIYKIEQQARFVPQASVGRPPGLVCCNQGSTRPTWGRGVGSGNPRKCRCNSPQWELLCISVLGSIPEGPAGDLRWPASGG